MTLLSICQAAASVAPVAQPVAIFGNSDETAQLLLGLANLAGQSIARRPPGGWVSMIKEYEFQTAAVAQQGGSIANTGPGGVAVISGLATTTGIQPNTWIASGTGVVNNSIVTAVTSSTVTLNLAATSTTGGNYSFGQSDYTLPSDFERPVDNTFWDRTRYWSMRGPQSPQMWQLYKSSVIGRASIQRRYRFRSIGGPTRLSIDPTPFDNGALLVFEYVSNAWCESQSGTPQAAWKADTDVGVIDEYLIQLDITWRMLRRLGLAYDEELAEFERQLDKAIAHDGGAAILDLTPKDYLTLIGPWNLPETGFGGPGDGIGAFSIGVSEIS